MAFAHLLSVFRLALPVALSQIGYMTLLLVDSLMVGGLGAAAIGGVAVGSNIFFSGTSLSMGALMGLDYLVSFSFGKHDYRKCAYWLVQGIYLALFLSIASMIVFYAFAAVIPYFNYDPAVEKVVVNFVRTCAWMTPAFLFFIAFRQYLQSMNEVTSVTIIVIVANLINALCNWLFIYGHAGFPAWGTFGSALSTNATRFFMLGAIIVVAIFHNRKYLKRGDLSWRFDRAGTKELFVLGFPAGMQLFFEIVMFSLSSLIAGKFGPVPLAAHTLVLHVASTAFMMGVGLSAASAVRVGQSMGEKKFDEARRLGWSAIALGLFVMCLSSTIFVTCRHALVSAFSSDPRVIAVGAKIFLFAAVFQIADGLQVVCTGCLRGLGETQFPMYANLIGHWIIGLPVGLTFAIYLGWGVYGIWMGLTIGLFVTAALTLWKWVTLSRKLRGR